VDTQVQEGVTYYYTVVATNDLGAGSTSGPVNGATVTPTPSPADDILPLAGVVIAGAAALTGVILWRRGKAKG